MTTREITNFIKSTLAEKLKDENTYFTARDIHVKAVTASRWIVTIEDYSPFSFAVAYEPDEFSEGNYTAWVYENYLEEFVSFDDGWDTAELLKDACLRLGYYIATRF